MSSGMPTGAQPSPPKASYLAEDKVRKGADGEVRRVVHEMRVMFAYAVEEGLLGMDNETRLLVADALREGDPHFLLNNPKELSRVMAAHGALSRIIAPATPVSLEATERAPGWLGSIRRPPLIVTMIIIAIISMIGFVLTSVIPPAGKSEPSEKKTGHVIWQRPIMVATFIAFEPDKSSLGVSPEAPIWLKQLNWLFAASLGAVFYVLFAAHEYVKNRTFDPRYNSVYVIRFVLGVLSGLVLANVMSAPRFNGNETLRSLGPSVAALLGGFSTEAVYQVLQRLVEVLLAAVRGDNSSAAKAQAVDSARKELLSLAADPTMPPRVVPKLQAAVKKVGQ